MKESGQQIITRENLSLNVETIGDPKNEACLLIAGAGAPCHFWTDTFCHYLVKNDFFVIRYDHRDVGLSSAVDYEKNPYELKDLANDAIDILNFFSIDKSHIIGHSMGGYVAQWFAATSPERVKKMVVIATGPIGEVANCDLNLTSSEKTLAEGVWKSLLANTPTSNFHESIDDYMTVWRLLNGTAALDEKMAIDYTRDLYFRSHFPPEFHRSHVAVIEKTNFNLKERSGLFASIQSPTLVIHGKEDNLLLPRITGIPVALAIPDAELQLIPKMGHMMFNQALEKDIASRILHFIKAEPLCS
ncbi:MAG: Hydrolase 4 protein [Parachlamydiales bacterium]|nr:Hydrolase 4 protein [Parachlamydiales bacterium]